MRVRILKEFITATRTFHAGEVTEIDPRKAADWVTTGLVMQDKSLDGAKEVKVRPRSSPKKRIGR